MKAPFLFLCLAAGCAGQGLQFWESIDLPVRHRGAVSAVLHTQVRLQDRFHDLFQARVGPVVRVRLTRSTLIAGYYFGEAEDKRIGRWGNNHRTFGGVETPFGWRSSAITLRTLGEHHFGGSLPSEVRFREQIQMVRRVWDPVAAIAATECFFDQRGFFLQRFSGGVRLPFAAGYRLDLTYLYDARLQRAGGTRQAIQVAFRPRSRER